MIKIIFLIIILILFLKDTEINEGFDGTILMKCPENYETTIKDMKNFKKYKDYVPYSDKEYYYLTLLLESKDPLPSDPDFFK